MFPLISISNLATLPFFIFVCVRFFISFQRKKETSIAYFFIVFLLVVIFEILLSTPGLIIKDASDISTIFAFYPFFVFLSLGFLAAVPFSIMKKKTEEIFSIALMFIISVISTVINLNSVSPAPILVQPPFIYWMDTRSAAMDIFIGIVAALVFIFVISFFFIQGIRAEDKFVRNRSFLLGSGLTVYFLASLVNFALGAFFQPYITSVISAFLAIISSIMIFMGARYKKTESVVPYREEKENI